MNLPIFIKILAGIIVAAVIMTFNLWASKVGLPSELPDGASLRQWFDELGAWGPVAVIGSMVVAILVSPIPSAPIALSAGAIYGHFWGALYVLIGSEIGAIAAFTIARFLGHDVLHKWFGDQLNRGLAGSQNFLMGTVFASRLMPFISFDIVSYAAGLTSLSFWRFAIATLAGIIPASFLLAHFGSELVADETDRILLAVVLLGALTALPFAVRLIAKSRQS
jgi:uncharacterized membrane protein YdjX (TVP38/TMEM64 family)